MAMAFRGFGQNAPVFTGQTPDFSAPAPTPVASPIDTSALGQKPAFFGEGGTGRAMAGYLGDFLRESNGMRPIYAPMMEQRRQEQLAQQQRQQDYAQAVRMQQMKLAAQGPDYTEFQKNMVAAGIQPGSPEWMRLSRQKAENDADKFVNFVAGGNTIAGPWSQVAPMLQGEGGGQISPQPGAVPPAPANGQHHLTVDQYLSVKRDMGGDFDNWYSRFKPPVLVNSKEEMDRLPSGTVVISADGRTGVKR